MTWVNVQTCSNDLDAERIDRLLEQPAYAGSAGATRSTRRALDRAQMCSPQMPNDVVTARTAALNSAI